MIQNRLIDIRESMGYEKKKDFAQYLGIERRQYGRYERNETQPHVETIYYICKKLNLDLFDIFYDTKDSKK